MLLNAQSGPRWYYNIDENNLAASGNDVVAYHSDDKAVAGSKSFQSIYKEVVYQFTTEANQAVFEKDPEKYLPAFGGWCTYIMGIDEAGGFPPTRLKSDPQNFKIINGKLYFFAKSPRQDFKQIFEAGDQEAVLTRANKFWESRVRFGEMYDGLPPGLNPMARMENLDWVPFLGRWDANASWWLDTAGVNKSAFTGDWTIAYGYDGYGVEDDFLGTPLSYAGTTNGPAIRGYDVVNKEWHMTYIPINQPRSATWLMTAKFVGVGHLEGQMETTDMNGNMILQKIVFKTKTEDSFEWSAHWSWDNGKTWKENTGLVSAKRHH
ncbi:hypothetical protein BFP71_06495 [Roseivirga misakiensis]|uniref:Uncharacterized protein n=2 Tax=Roseivirga misakiensis TaxID=1563681 RepID=A0A1E5T337_9BACT|nr:hypothetical protein BFP71_06495 [Roseivirga misakiensis]